MRIISYKYIHINTNLNSGAEEFPSLKVSKYARNKRGKICISEYISYIYIYAYQKMPECRACANMRPGKAAGKCFRTFSPA